jgi:hypothetical protein
MGGDAWKHDKFDSIQVLRIFKTAFLLTTRVFFLVFLFSFLQGINSENEKEEHANKDREAPPPATTIITLLSTTEEKTVTEEEDLKRRRRREASPDSEDSDASLPSDI